MQNAHCDFVIFGDLKNGPTIGPDPTGPRSNSPKNQEHINQKNHLGHAVWMRSQAWPVFHARVVSWLVCPQPSGSPKPQKYSLRAGQKKDEEGGVIGRARRAKRARPTSRDDDSKCAAGSHFFMHNSGLADTTVRVRVWFGVPISLTTPKALLDTGSTARSFLGWTGRPAIRFRALIAGGVCFFFVVLALARISFGPTIGRSIDRVHQSF
jgi:hypothetical protein